MRGCYVSGQGGPRPTVYCYAVPCHFVCMYVCILQAAEVASQQRGTFMRTTHANHGARPHHCWSPATFYQTAGFPQLPEAASSSARHLCPEMSGGFGGCPSNRPISSVLPMSGYGRHRRWLPSSKPLVRSSWLNGPIVSCLFGCREAVCRPCQAVCLW